MKKVARKLSIRRETLVALESKSLTAPAGGVQSNNDTVYHTKAPTKDNTVYHTTDTSQQIPV
jgi:hypothetical protein